MIEVKKISALDTYPVRLEVLRKNIPLPYQFNGDLDSDTFHLGVFKNNQLIAVSSYMKAENSNFKGSQYQLRGMATLSEYQGLGAGKLMMEKAVAILKEFHINCLWCNARVVAVPFYEKQGLKTFGDKFNIQYVGGHYVMYKYL
ncbi:GNAT family N-acetyltransferase [Lutibacter maritimus]|uniref:Predicted N-acyltransferase, GNAT family n=1 Tax=Lutibacter maritimus TaxID=593133 RepID=A0A1I6SIL1_9FLAO|nr:GNAT family N-acetyltransferase [Lutibacter maritimus]SFS76744.1 Predicted N-acyltransferase, GNAT family [Lutibacter maritimus]